MGNDKHHLRIIAALSAVFLLLNVVIYARQPYVWIDEAYFADPAINLVKGKGFTSAVWSNSAADETFVSTAPIFSLALAGWLRVFGTGMLAVRSFDYFLMTAALALIVIAALRLGLITRQRQIVLLYLLVGLGYGTSFAYRSARPEPLVLTVAAAAFFSFTWRARTARIIFLSLVGLVAPGLGPHVMVYFALVFAVSAMFLWRRVFLEGAAVAVGMLAGFALLKFSYDYLGVWNSFVSVVESKGGMNIFARIQERLFSDLWRDHSGIIPKDFSLFPLMLFMLLALWYRWRTDHVRWRTPEVFGLVFVTTVFLGMFLVAKFSTYYSWMVYAPTALVCCACWALFEDSRWLRVSRALLIMAACAVGLPFQMAVASLDWKDRNPARMERWADQVIQPNDVVFSDYPAFYAVKAHAAKTYFLFHWPKMTAEKKAGVTLLLLSPYKTYGKSAEELIADWDQNWQLVDEFIPIRTGALGHDWRFGYLSLPNYHLQAYRRRSAGAESSAIGTKEP